MKHFVLACVTGAAFCCAACAHSARQPLSHSSDSPAHADSPGKGFFPVAEVLESEILQVDSTPLALHEFITIGGRTDSSFIPAAEFNSLAMQFIVPEFRDGSFEKDFTETSFMDRGTRDVSFTYSATSGDLPLRRVDVIATPTGAAHQMKSVYLERSRVSGDSIVLQKMYWQAGRDFLVISLIRVKGKPPVERQLKVIWNTDEDNE